MGEHQNVEWKESWRDEYLKWICGFANAQGGTLLVGKNDHGKIIGLSNTRKLLEDIPNKVRDILGIMVDVNLKTEGKHEYLEIVVEPQPYPVNYKGEYHYRSGSTKQELKGTALDAFLLKKQGLTWDGVPLPRLSLDDCSDTAMQFFKSRAIKSGRMNNAVTHDPKENVLKNLQLWEGRFLKRAAALLFSDTPENFVTGAYIKIGYFITDDDLRYQDEIHGNLFQQIEKTLEILSMKYLKAFIRYEGVHRIEEFLFPMAALREALLNAVVHKDYSSGIPIQLSVYEHQIVLWNSGRLPDEWTLDYLNGKHPSSPYNPLLAGAFFRAGYIESWGRGIEKIRKECLRYGMVAPIYNDGMNGLMVTFRAGKERLAEALGAEIASQLLSNITAEKVGDNGLKVGDNGLKVGDNESKVGDNGSKVGDNGSKVGDNGSKVGDNGSKIGDKGLKIGSGVGDNWLKVGDEVGDNLNDRQRSILALLQQTPALTVRELALKVDISTRKVESNLAKLKAAGYLVRIGAPKGGYWQVMKADQFHYSLPTKTLLQIG